MGSTGQFKGQATQDAAVLVERAEMYLARVDSGNRAIAIDREYVAERLTGAACAMTTLAGTLAQGYDPIGGYGMGCLSLASLDAMLGELGVRVASQEQLVRDMAAFGRECYGCGGLAIRVVEAHNAERAAWVACADAGTGWHIDQGQSAAYAAAKAAYAAARAALDDKMPVLATPLGLTR